MKKVINYTHQQLHQVQTKISSCYDNVLYIVYTTAVQMRARYFFSFENGGSSWNFWELAIGERAKLEVKNEKENMPLIDTVAIVAEVYGAVCQLYLRLWNRTLAT